MYSVSSGGQRFGTTVAVHTARNTLSIFAGVNANYAILRGGCLSNRSRLVLEGFWRYAASADTGLLRLEVGPPEVAAALCAEQGPGTAALPPATLAGATGVSAGQPTEATSFTYQHALIDPGQRFSIVGHHGACQTIDDCGFSENSVESIRQVEAFGASVVELDVRLTSDGIPILFHDDTFSPRLNNGIYCHGRVNQFSMAHVRALCRLRYNEQIPTLEESLQAVIDQTALDGVWLDVKEPEAVALTLAIMDRYNAEAQRKNRRLSIVIGLGAQDVLDKYRSLAPPPPGTRCLVELEPQDVRDANCDFWGPRWTRGPMSDAVRALQEEGRSVVYWSIDEPDFMDLFLTAGKPNGMLSGRPGLLFHRYQTVGTVPAGGPSL
jgi:glycerophosphoryl diester phosphodiesterase